MQYVPDVVAPAKKAPKTPMKGLSITALIMGIMSLTTASYGFFFAVLALVFGIVSRKCGNRGKASLVGMILGIVCLGLWAVVLIILIGVSIGMGSSETGQELFVNFMNLL